MKRQLDMLVILSLTLGILALLPAPATALDLRSWDQHIDNGRSRFQVLRAFNNEAVLDKETGLVWERSPETTTRTWLVARQICANGREIGSRRGWRLPSFPELASLMDLAPTSDSDPQLPTGHPFTNVLRDLYWSATTDDAEPTFAWGVHFDGRVFSVPKTGNSRVWCVRGGGLLEAY